MAISEKQLAANRANARKSKGPITPEGRRNSSRNSTRHGLLAKVVLIDGESQDRFNAMVNSFIAEFEPDSPTELAIVQRIAVANWQQMRTWALNSAGVSHEMRSQAASLVNNEDAATRAMLAVRALGDGGRHLDIMSRYEYRFDRQYYHALEALAKHRERRARAARSHLLEQNKGPAEIVDPILIPMEPAK